MAVRDGRLGRRAAGGEPRHRLHPVPRGVTSCLTLPVATRWNEVVDGGRQREAARPFGGAATAKQALRGFIAGLGLPVRLADVGIASGEIPALAALWGGDTPITTNPRPVRGAADLEEILRSAAWAAPWPRFAFGYRAEPSEWSEAWTGGHAPPLGGPDAGPPAPAGIAPSGRFRRGSGP